MLIETMTYKSGTFLVHLDSAGSEHSSEHTSYSPGKHKRATLYDPRLPENAIHYVERQNKVSKVNWRGTNPLLPPHPPQSLSEVV